MIQRRRHCESSVLGLKAVASSLRWTEGTPLPLGCFACSYGRLSLCCAKQPEWTPPSLLLLHAPWCQDSACLLHFEPRETESCRWGTSFRVPARLSHCARATKFAPRVHMPHACIHTNHPEVLPVVIVHVYQNVSARKLPDLRYLVGKACVKNRNTKMFHRRVCT